MRVTLVILAVIGLAAASPVTEQQAQKAITGTNARNDVIEQIVVAIIDNIRDLIINENELTPPLDPYQKDYYYFDAETLGQPGSHHEIKDIYATGLSSFELEEIDVETISVLLQWYRAHFTIVIPVIEGTIENMRHTIVILAAIGFAAASPLTGQQAQTSLTSLNVDARNDVIERIVVALLDNLRDLVVNGNESTPPFDPYHRDYYYIDEQALGQPGSHLEVKNIYATGLGSFELENVRVETTSILLQWYRAHFTIVIPVIEGSIEHYDVYASVFNTLIWGTGDVKYKIINLRFSGHLDIAATIREGIYLNIFNSHVSAKIDDILPVVTGVFDNEVSSEYASQWLRETILFALNAFEFLVTGFVSNAVQTKGNEFLKDVNVAAL